MSHADQIESMVSRVLVGRWSRSEKGRLEFTVETHPEVTFTFDGADRLSNIDVSYSSSFDQDRVDEILSDVHRSSNEARAEIEDALKLITSQRAQDALRSALSHLDSLSKIG
jgi:hypothetical protein